MEQQSTEQESNDSHNEMVEEEGNEEENEFHHTQSHTFENGMLILEEGLTSGRHFEVPFNMLKNIRPIEVAHYIKNNVIEQSRIGYHKT